jgi:DNA polymerase V
MTIMSLFEDLPRCLTAMIVRYQPDSIFSIPLYDTRVSAGFPSPAEDYLDKTLDLNDLVIQHPAATFFVKVEGNSMIDAGIHSGDVLVIDRALDPADNRVVVAIVDGGFTVKRIRKCEERLFLIPENPDHDPIEIDPESDFQIWGIVTYVIHPIR